MSFADDLTSFMQDRFQAFDPSIDLSPGSPVQTQIIGPLIQRLGEDPLDIDLATFLSDRIIQEFPELQADAGGLLEEMLINPMQLFLEPLKREIQLAKNNQSVQNAILMADAEADALGANFFEPRIDGDFASGPVRVFFAAPVTVSITTDKQFSTNSGLAFFAVENFKVTATQMLFNRQGNLYYMDVTVKADQPGPAYNVDVGDINSVENVDGVVKVSNLTKFSTGEPREDNVTYLGRIDQALTERSLVTKRGAIARTQRLFPDIQALQIVGAGEVGMDRDILTGTGEGFLHLVGDAVLYGDWIFISAVNYKDDGPDNNLAIAVGDTVKFQLTADQDPTLFIYEATVSQDFSITPGTITERHLLILKTSINLTGGILLPALGRVAVLKPGFITISNIPGGISSIIQVPDDQVHLGGHTDIFVRPGADNTELATLANVIDSAPLVAALNLNTTLGSNLIASVTTGVQTALDFVGLGIQPGDLFVLETGGDLAGTYTILSVGSPDTNHQFRINVILNSTQTALRGRIVRGITVDLVEPKTTKLPFLPGPLTDLTTVIGSTLFRFTQDTQTFGVVVGDTIRILEGPNLGDYVITAFDATLGGQGPIVNNAALASSASQSYQIFTKQTGLNLPLVRVKTIEVLDSSNQSSGVNVPYGDAVDIRPNANFTGAGNETQVLEQDIIILPDMAGIWSPPRVTHDGAASSGAPTLINSATAAFSIDKDYGNGITLAGAGVAGGLYTGIITGVVSPTQVTVSPNISTTVSAATLTIGILVPVPATPGAQVDARFSLKLESADGIIESFTADYHNPIDLYELNIPPFLWNGKKNKFLAFADIDDLPYKSTNPTGQNRTSAFVGTNVGDSVVILDGVNQGTYLVKDIRVFEMWGKRTAAGARSAADGAASTGTPTIITSTLIVFGPADVGREITLAGAGVAGGLYSGVITAFSSLTPHQVSVTPNISTNSSAAAISVIAQDPGRRMVAVVEVDKEFACDPLRTAMRLMLDQFSKVGGHTYTPMTSLQMLSLFAYATDRSVFLIPESVDSNSFWNLFGDKLQATLTELGITITTTEVKALLLNLVFTGYQVGPSAKGIVRCFFQEAVSVEMYFGDNPTTLQANTDASKNFRLPFNEDNAQIFPESPVLTLPGQWDREVDMDVVGVGQYLFLNNGASFAQRGVLTGDILEFRPAYNCMRARRDMASSWLAITTAGSNTIRMILPPAPFSEYNNFGLNASWNFLDGLQLILWTQQDPEIGDVIFIDSGPDFGAYYVTNVVSSDFTANPPSVIFQVDRILTSSTLPFPVSAALDFGINGAPAALMTSGQTFPTSSFAGLQLVLHIFYDGGKNSVTRSHSFHSTSFANIGALVTELTSSTSWDNGAGVGAGAGPAADGLVVTSSGNELIIRTAMASDIGASPTGVGSLVVLKLILNAAIGPGLLIYSGHDQLNPVFGSEGAVVQTIGTNRVYAAGLSAAFVGDWLTLYAVGADGTNPIINNALSDVPGTDDKAYLGSFAVTAVGTETTGLMTGVPFVDLDRSQPFFNGTPAVNNVIGNVRWIKHTAPLTTPSETHDGGREISNQFVRARMYKGQSEFLNIFIDWLSAFPNPLLPFNSSPSRGLEQIEVLDPITSAPSSIGNIVGVSDFSFVHKTPFRILRPGVRRISSTQMATTRERGLYFFDLPILGYGPTSDMNIPDTLALRFTGRIKIQGYTFAVADETLTYSLQEKVNIILPNLVLPVGSTPDLTNNIALAGQNLQLTYDDAPTVADVQRFVSSPLDRVTVADLLVRHFLPIYVYVDAVYFGGSDVSTIATDLINYINSISPDDNTLRVDRIIKLIQRRNAIDVTLPIVVTALAHGKDRRIRGEQSDNTVGIPAKPQFDGTFAQAYFIAGPNTSLDTVRPDLEQVFLVRM